MAELREGTGVTFVVTARHIVEDEGALGKMLIRQLLLDPLLPRQKPVQGMIEFVLVGIGDGEFFCYRGSMPEPCRREFR